MNTRIVSTVLVFLTIFAAHAGRTPAAESEFSQNAALQYWKAFAVLPELSNEQGDAVLEALKQGTTDESLREVIKSSESALKEFHKGAELEACNWGISVDEGPAVILPHLSKSRQLSRLACLRAQMLCQQGQASEAIEDVIAVMRLARHVGKDGVLVLVLVDYAIERIAIETIATNLPSLDAAQLQNLARQLETLPPRPTVSEAVIAEKEWLAEWVIRVLAEPDGKDQMIGFFNGADDDPVKATRQHTSEEWLASAKQLRGFYDRLAKAVTLPPDKVKQAEEQLVANPGVDRPAREIALELVPAIGAARNAEAAHQTRLALIAAAVAAQQDGPDALKNDALRDPFGSSPFTYTKTENGFTLQSSFRDRKGQPVSLTIGRP